MSNYEPKQLALIRILQILKEQSDAEHPMTQADIAAHLENEYGIELERKAISRDLSLLKEAGFQIESGRRGSYISERELSDPELRLLIDGILGSRHISASRSKLLIDKLCGLSNKRFRSRVKYIHSLNQWNKTESDTLFRNIELIDTAIESNRQIVYRYNKYGADLKLHETSTQQTSPYQMILHNQRYYLMGLSEHWGNMVFHRLDRISGIEITDTPRTRLRSVPGYENGIDYKALSTAAYMYTDKAERIEIEVDANLMDHVVDWFGKDLFTVPMGDRVRVMLTTSPNAMEYWALQYLKYVEVISPKSLRDRIREAIEHGAEKYRDRP